MKVHSFDNEENLVKKINLPKIGSRTLDSTLKCYGGSEYQAQIVLFPFYKSIDFIKDVYYHMSRKPHLHVESILDLDL